MLLGSFAMASAQQPTALGYLTPDQISASDTEAVQAHQAELAESAKIYGYDIDTGNWTYRQSICSSMPDWVMLQYHQYFSNGSESLFSALIPRGAGRVHIIPVLYRNATTITSAAGNPYNYAIFNEAVPASIAGKSVKPGGDAIALATCYAEMTGATIDRDKSEFAYIPVPRAQLNSHDNTIRVLTAGPEGENGYRQWSIAFNQKGRVVSAASEAYSQGSSAQMASSVSQTSPATRNVAAVPAVSASSLPQPDEGTNAQMIPAPEQEGNIPVAEETMLPAGASPQYPDPGWKQIPAAPPSQWKLMKPAPSPPAKISMSPNQP